MTRMNKSKFLLSVHFALTIVVIAIISGCGGEKNGLESTVVAQVGDRNISAPEFLLNYEFGFAHLKKSPDKKLSYLEYMINEKLLSLEGYRLGLDKTERLRNLENRLLEELLVEEIFKKEVDEKIKISPKDVKEAIAKSNVSWKLRYWVESDFESSDNLYRTIHERGYSEIVQGNQVNKKEVSEEIQDLETDYLTWIDFPPELLNSIENLQIGEISEPVEYNSAYYLFQVIDIRMEGLSQYDYQTAYKRYEQILYYRKLNEETAKYVSSFMTPMNVVTKGDEFRMLADALSEWKQQDKNRHKFLESLEKAGKSEPASLLLNNHLEKTLISFDDESWTLREFINRFDPGSIKTDPSKKQKFRNELNRKIARSIRNHLLLIEARVQGLDKSPGVQEQLQTWRDKWVYEETRLFYTKNVKIDDTIALNYFEDHKSRYKTVNGNKPTFKEFANQARQYAYLKETQSLLEQKINSLKNEFKVRINHEALDAISVIDFKKSRWANVLLFKRSNGRFALPFVDPAWGVETNYN